MQVDWRNLNFLSISQIKSCLIACWCGVGPNGTKWRTPFNNQFCGMKDKSFNNPIKSLSGSENVSSTDPIKWRSWIPAAWCFPPFVLASNQLLIYPEKPSRLNLNDYSLCVHSTHPDHPQNTHQQNGHQETSGNQQLLNNWKYGQIALQMSLYSKRQAVTVKLLQSDVEYIYMIYSLYLMTKTMIVSIIFRTVKSCHKTMTR